MKLKIDIPFIQPPEGATHYSTAAGKYAGEYECRDDEAIICVTWYKYSKKVWYEWSRGITYPYNYRWVLTFGKIPTDAEVIRK